MIFALASLEFSVFFVWAVAREMVNVFSKNVLVSGLANGLLEVVVRGITVLVVGRVNVLFLQIFVF